jgi:hypothetical protein
MPVLHAGWPYQWHRLIYMMVALLKSSLIDDPARSIGQRR